MKNYVKPVVLANEELAEGVYAASGDCYTVTGYIHQTPETGRETYVMQFNAVHAAADGHHGGAQVLIITFNQPVTYVSSAGTLCGGDGTNVISIDYGYHNNQADNIGLGDVQVASGDGLAIVGAVLTCNHDCGQH
ncbi:MAG: hypothetical protein J6Z22_00115 [Lachnospiraceae bacterium]|nr:hypothetical protein [Lachnospiraceae bacterium]